MVSFLTLKSPFCKYEVAKDQDNTEENNESDENEKEESKLAAVADSIKEGSYDIGYLRVLPGKEPHLGCTRPKFG